MEKGEIDFGKEKISTIFRKMFFPTLAGMASIALMCVIDGIFVSHTVGARGVAAVNFCNPVYSVMAAVGLMVALGSSVVASIHLSHGQEKDANLNVTQGFLFAALVGVILSVSLIVFRRPLARLLGAEESLVEMVASYICGLAPAIVFDLTKSVCMFSIRLDGSPKYAMMANVVPALVNILLDWVFLYPLNMGVFGAALATTAGIFSGWVMAVLYMLRYSEKVHFQLPKLSCKSLRLSVRNIGYQCKLGFGSFVSEICGGVYCVVGNLVFMKYLGTEGVGAFGIICYYNPLLFMIAYAIVNSMQPVISFNYGLDDWSRVRKSAFKCFHVGGLAALTVTFFFIFLPKPLIELFLPMGDPSARLALEGFPLFGTGMLFYMCNIIAIGYFQSIEKPALAIVGSVLRGAVFVIPAFLLMPVWWGAAGMWLVLPVCELLTSLIIIIPFIKTLNYGRQNKPQEC